MSVLEKILDVKKKEVEKCKQLVPVTKMKKLAIEKCTSTSCENKFKEIFKKENFCIIGEIKRASPSEGIISENVDVKEIAKLYESLGFFAISVLTEKNFFKGTEQDLMDVKSATSLPVLRKDFIIDIWQLYQTKIIGADAALLITKALSEKQLSIFIKVLEILDIVPLVEVENEYEIEKALNCGAKLIGINNRNLDDLTIDLKKTERLLKYIPKDVAVISESGIKSREDFEYIRSLGVDGCLIGTSFMKTQNPVEIIGERI
ncbi:indole-3-glycerol phosphate synthase TrpC [Caldicellulosiruptor naganoensis]|uniref:indole-3-glycerol-phosphate synthase n=1 Tax=Caldicellulosiruptor naganoensis TaxID=29324 RepID=A0ABY7BN75_9FIRM|nr:indole-3-glycerol phosphate synthase TrpC [Caldicellulosiruptor naganoensis]WAM32476.1 indole-3-glycerol phosphate synthase TrpC [Caldicellulosiruptor naganoensis]